MAKWAHSNCGHSMGFSCLRIKDKWFSIFASLLIALIAFSRLYLGVHDLGDVFAGLVIGLIILGAWHVALRLNIDQNLSYRNSFLLLFGFQVLIYLTYPSHQDHELSIWLLGVMTGWLLVPLKFNSS